MQLLKNIKTLYDLRETITKLFNDYSKIASLAKYRSTHGKGLKILTPKQMFQRLLIFLGQVKAGNTYENLLKETCQLI